MELWQSLFMKVHGEQVEELRKIIILPDTAFTVILQKELMLHPKKRIY